MPILEYYAIWGKRDHSIARKWQDTDQAERRNMAIESRHCQPGTLRPAGCNCCRLSTKAH